MVKNSTLSLCEHDEIPAACLDCLAQPQKVEPRVAATIRATKSPQSAKDKISPLNGDMDMSIPIDDAAPFIGNQWLNIRVFPHYLKRSGWVYLRSDGRLQARVKAMKVVWQDSRKDPSEHSKPLGAGMAIEVDPSTWDKDIDIDLGSLAAQQNDGYRYLKSNSDGTVTHYRGNKPIPHLDIDDED